MSLPKKTKVTSKENRKGIFLLIFFLSTTLLVLTYLSETKVITKKAEEAPLQISFGTLPQEQIKRIWNNFAQGGEEKIPMLKPAEKEIRKLQPSLIRIDHLFDVYDIVKKDPSDKLIFNFSDLDRRVEEIISLGATPFLSLSYFPSAISSEMTKFPASLQDWQVLVEKTIQRYSGRTEKNLLGMYYEVWNEPDLFGKMSPETYFSLYLSSVTASQNCQNCNPFKIGGPAIATAKKDWLNSFLNLVFQNKLRLDFISWHSYQTDPAKTSAEIENLKALPSLKGLSSQAELVISEWGSTPEISPLHDSYFDSSHTVAAVASIGNQIDKLFTFELKDGPSPEGKQFWGRWGLLTHQSYGLTTKPRYYSFLYLNKLLDFRLNPLSTPPGIWTIGSTDGKESYTIVTSRISEKEGPKQLQIRLLGLLPGIYTSNIYSLDSLHPPFLSQPNTISFNGGELNLSLPAYPSGVNLVEIVRISPALIKAGGKTQDPNDFSSKITSFVPPLVFFINQENQNTGEISFWFKPSWGIQDKQVYGLLESKNEKGEALSAWVDKNGSESTLHFSSGINQEAVIRLAWTENTWHHLIFTFDNQKRTLTAKVDDQEASTLLPEGESIKLGRSLYIGASSDNDRFAEGLVDDLTIFLNDQILYNKNFNQEPPTAPE